MSFKTRAEFTSAQSSEKLTLVHVDARTRLFEWTLHAGSVWVKNTPHYAVGLKQGSVDMVIATSEVGLNENMFYYDPKTSNLYAHFDGSVDPTTIEAIVTYRFFYASGPCTASSDLTNLGDHVQYQGRVLSSPGYKHRVGIDQSLTSVVGSGTLKLENGDGLLDSVFDTLFYENRDVAVYSWNRDLDYDQAKVIYRGRITNKTFSSDSVSFTIKDRIFDLEQALPLVPYTDTDNVNDDVKGRYKRWVYGRVDGLKLQSIDQIGEGYTIAGTVSGIAVSNVLTGVGTSFLQDTSPGDLITIGTQEFTIDSVNSDTEIILDDELVFGFTGQTATLLPEIPTTNKNRDFFVAGHACSNLTYTVQSVLQLNRVELDSTTGLNLGDIIQFATGERREIRSIAPGNIVVLQTNLITSPTLLTTVTRDPIQRIYKESTLINSGSYTISNLGAPTNQCTITLSSTLEVDQTRSVNPAFNMTFTNGSRTITTADDVDLRETFSPRDFLRPDNIAYTTFYEILSVSETSLDIRTVFSEVTITGGVTAKLPDYIGDDTVISSEVIGRTENGEPSGTWIKTGAQVVRDILKNIDVSTDLINETSFTNAAVDAKQTISLALPTTTTGGAVKAKSALDLVNKSIFGGLTLDNDLKLKYKILQIDVPSEPTLVFDEDLVNWSVKTTNGKNFRDSVIKYRHKDVDRFSLVSGTSLVTYTSTFVSNYIETSKLKEENAYLFNATEAAIFAERLVYYNRLSQSDIKLDTDLRFENVEIGDVMQLEMKRLYKRMGDNSQKKLAMVVGKIVDGEKVTLELTDLGNLYNSSAVIAPNTLDCHALATEDERLKYGFITNSEGIVDSDEDTANTNLIS